MNNLNLNLNNNLKMEYQKYKDKYLNLKNILKGGNPKEDLEIIIKSFESNEYYNITELVCNFVMNKSYKDIFGKIQNKEDICTNYGKKISQTLIRDVIEHIFNIKEQFIVELIVNGFDAQRTTKSVGKFGVGFFSSLVPLIDNQDINLSIISRYNIDGQLLKYKLSFKFDDSNFLINVKKHEDLTENNSIGLEIIYESTKNFSEEFIKNINSEIEKLKLFDFGTLYLNSKIVNIFNPVSSKTVEVIFNNNMLKVIDKGVGITIETLLTKLLVPSTSTKGLNYETPKLVYEEDNLTRIIEKTNKDNYSEFYITVNSVVIYKTKIQSNNNLIYQIALPSNFDVPIARNDILLDRDDLFEVLMEHLKKLYNLTINNLKDITELDNLFYGYLDYTTQTFAVNKIKNNLSNYLENHNKISIPSNKKELNNIIKSIGANYFYSNNLNYIKLRKLIETLPKYEIKLFMNVDIIKVTSLVKNFTLIFDQYLFTNITDNNLLLRESNKIIEMEIIPNVILEGKMIIEDELNTLNNFYLKTINKKISELQAIIKYKIMENEAFNSDLYNEITINLNKSDDIIFKFLKHIYVLSNLNVKIDNIEVLIYILYRIGSNNIDKLQSIYYNFIIKFSILNIHTKYENVYKYGHGRNIYINLDDQLDLFNKDNKLFEIDSNIDYKYPLIHTRYSYLNKSLSEYFNYDVDKYFRIENFSKELKLIRISGYNSEYYHEKPFFDESILKSLIIKNDKFISEIKKIYPIITKIISAKNFSNKILSDLTYEHKYNDLRDYFITKEVFNEYYEVNKDNLFKNIKLQIENIIKNVTYCFIKLDKKVTLKYIFKSSGLGKVTKKIIKNIFEITNNYGKLIEPKFQLNIKDDLDILFNYLEIERKIKEKSYGYEKDYNPNNYNFSVAILSHVNKIYKNLKEQYDTLLFFNTNKYNNYSPEEFHDLVDSFLKSIYKNNMDEINKFNEYSGYGNSNDDEDEYGFGYGSSYSDNKLGLYDMIVIRENYFIFMMFLGFFYLISLLHNLVRYRKIFNFLNQTEITKFESYFNFDDIIKKEYLSREIININLLKDNYDKNALKDYNEMKYTFNIKIIENKLISNIFWNKFNKKNISLDIEILKQLDLTYNDTYEYYFLNLIPNNIINNLDQDINEHIFKLNNKLREKYIFKPELYLTVFLHVILYSFKNKKFIKSFVASELINSDLITKLLNESNLDKIVNFLILLKSDDIEQYLQDISKITLYDFRKVELEEIKTYYDTLQNNKLFILINNFINLILDENKNLKVIEINTNPDVVNLNKKIKLSNLIKLLYTHNVDNFENLLKLKDDVTSKFNLQLITLAINSGSPNQVERSVCIELLQNSIDATNSKHNFRDWTKNINYNCENITSYDLNQFNIDIEIGYQKDGTNYNIIYINRDYVGFNSLNNLISLSIPYFSEKTLNSTGKMGNGFFNSYRNSVNVKIRSKSNTVNFLIDDTPLDNEGKTGTNKLVEDLNKDIIIFNVEPISKPYTDIIVTYKSQNISMFNNIISLLYSEAKNILTSIPLFNIKLNDLNINNKNKLIYSSENIKVYVKNDINTVSYVLTDNVPYQTLEMFLLKQDIRTKINKFLFSGIIIDINSRKFKPVQSRIDAIVDKDVIEEIKRELSNINFINLLNKQIIAKEEHLLYEITNNSLFLMNQIIPNVDILKYDDFDYTKETIIVRHKLFSDKSINERINEILSSRHKYNFCDVLDDFSSILDKYIEISKTKKEVFDKMFQNNLQQLYKFLYWINELVKTYKIKESEKYNSWESYCEYISYLWIYNKVINFDEDINFSFELYRMKVDYKLSLDDLSKLTESTKVAVSIDFVTSKKKKKEINSICNTVVQKFINTYIDKSFKIYDSTFNKPYPTLKFYYAVSGSLGYYMPSRNTINFNANFLIDIKDIIMTIYKYKEKALYIIRNQQSYKKFFSGLYFSVLPHELEHYRRGDSHVSTDCGSSGTHDSIVLNVNGKNIEHSYNQCILFFYKIARQNNILEEWYKVIIDDINKAGENNGLDFECDY